MMLDEILSAYKNNTLTIEEAQQQIQDQFLLDTGRSTLDMDRLRRTGASEVIYGEFKSAEQIKEKVLALTEMRHNVLATRVSEEKYSAIANAIPAAVYCPVAQLLSLKVSPNAVRDTSIAIITAGTSDEKVAEEAALTAEFYDNPVLRIRDVGVAGLHRLFARLDEIRSARVLIVIAGMEGALPSVVGGLVDKPVIAVPTSVGYGASFGGVSALLGMLNSCAAGVSVVNIDNGFGAGFLASKINAL